MGEDIFILGRGGAGPGPGAGNPTAVACIAATIWANRVAPAGGGTGGPAGPTGPTGLGGPGGPGGGGGSGGGASPPPEPPPLPPGGTGAAISKTQHNNKLNLTLLVNNWSIDQPSTACASILVTCMLLWAYRLQVILVTCYNNL